MKSTLITSRLLVGMNYHLINFKQKFKLSKTYT